MNRRLGSSLPLAALALLASALAAAEPGTAPASATASAPAYRTKFEPGDSATDFFTALSLRFGVAIVQPKPVKAFILKGFELPDKFDEAMAIGQTMLEAQGLTLYKSVNERMIVLRIIPTEEAKKLELLESPVTAGVEPERIDISRPTRMATHLLPVSHPELIDAMVRQAKQDKEIQADIAGAADTGFTLIISGPAKNLQEAVENLVKVDRPDAAKVAARTIQLHHLNSMELADSLNATFAAQGDGMRAVADRRTNSIIVTGPEDKVLNVMVLVIGMEASRGRVLPPAPETLPAESVPGTQPASTTNP